MRRRREIGSKYFGRVVKKWRLAADLSQEELAERADVSVGSVGAVERERSHLSAEIFCRLCLGLESKLGRPTLEPVFCDVIEVLWRDLLSSERGLRQERGWAPAEYETLDVSQEHLEAALDSTLAEAKKYALLWHRALGFRMKGSGWLSLSRADLAVRAVTESDGLLVTEFDGRWR
jgi:transcriptional regulator with XRE-family HTH domain